MLVLCQNLLLDWSLNRSSTKNDNNAAILVVDDEYDIVNLIKQSLEVNRLRVCAFTDAFVALDHLNSHAKDYHSVVIPDIRMPGINGYEFVKKAKEIDKQSKIVFMSAFEINDSDFHNVLPDIKIGGFLQKLFSIHQLNDIMDKISIRA
jgi:DNA-binding NtrC family response regulator